MSIWTCLGRHGLARTPSACMPEDGRRGRPGEGAPDRFPASGPVREAARAVLESAALVAELQIPWEPRDPRAGRPTRCRVRCPRASAWSAAQGVRVVFGVRHTGRRRAPRPKGPDPGSEVPVTAHAIVVTAGEGSRHRWPPQGSAAASKRARERYRGGMETCRYVHVSYHLRPRVPLGPCPERPSTGPVTGMHVRRTFPHRDAHGSPACSIGRMQHRAADAAWMRSEGGKPAAAVRGRQDAHRPGSGRGHGSLRPTGTGREPVLSASFTKGRW